MNEKDTNKINLIKTKDSNKSKNKAFSKTNLF